MTAPPKTPRRIAKVVILGIIVSSAFLVSAGTVTVVGSRVLMPAITNDLTATRPRREQAAVAGPTIAATAGSNQTAPINTNFPVQLQVIVTDSDVPQSGIEVTFTAPVDGAGGTFTGNATATVTTDENGLATAPELTANGLAGSYQISATIPEATTTFDLTNAKGDQTIDFAAIPDKVFGNAAFEITATASSGLPVSFSIESGLATISGQTVTITGLGSVTVRASQAGDDNYEPATPVDQTFVVAKADQTISFEPLPNMTNGDADFEVSAIASSGLEVTITTMGHCTVSALTVHLAGPGSCTLIAAQSGDTNFNAAPTVKQSFFIGEVGELLFNLKAFGAVGDGVANDSPALQAALNDIASAGGGTLVVPPGRYALVTPVIGDFAGHATSITIRGIESDAVVSTAGGGKQLATGLGLSSEFLPKTGTTGALAIMGLHTFNIAEVAFVGTPGVFNDATTTLYFRDVEDATVRHCEFYGLSANGGGVILAQRSGLRIEQTKFLGSFGASGAYTPTVQNLEWKSITLKDVVFVDYGLRPELYGKGNMAATLSWVNIGNAAAVTAASPRREVVFDNVFCDEGAYLGGLTSMPGWHSPASAPIDLVYISKLRMNVPNFGITGHYFTGLQNVLIADSHYSWSHNADSAMHFFDAANVILDNLECVDHADRIRADAATHKLTVINSTYGELASQAQTTNVLTFENADDDPVQYVRQRFVASLGREPDPAAHYFWANNLLNCGAGAQCIADTNQALETYLAAAPVPNFSLTGTVTDEQGAPLRGVIIALTGSQSVTTQTDVNGQYQFTGLPTSGNYTLTPSLTHYTFDQASQLVTTPANDHVANFNAIINRYTISGALTNASGIGIPDVTISLSGSNSAITSTDAAGMYSFTVPALGDYTLTPAKPHYSFSPAATSFNALASNQSASFLATPVNYTVSGRVTAGGAALSGATITVGGSASATTTTDSNGNYLVTLPALGNYTLTPSLTHYAFAPAQLNVESLSGNQIENFAGTPVNYTVSGRVTDGGAALSGATITVSGSAAATMTTDANGNYSVTLAAFGNYTLTPSLKHYTFAPAQLNVESLSGNQIESFAGTPVNYTVSGRVTDGGAALSGAKITVSGSAAATMTTDANGNYSVTLAALGNYTLTPSLKHYTFAPAQLNFNTLNANQNGDVVATRNRHSISGSVMRSDGAGAVPEAIVTLSGATSATTTTSATGQFVFSNLSAGGNYTVSVAKAHYVLSPANRPFDDLSSDQSANFTATPPVTINGRVSVDGAALPGATVALTGTESGNAVTDVDGDYSFIVAVGSYQIAVSKTHYSFTPQRLSFNNITTNQSGNFSGSLNQYKITGRILNPNNSGLAQVVVTLSGSQNGSVLTDANGSFTFAALAAGGSYVVTTSGGDYLFEPSSSSFADLSADQDLMVVGTPPPPELLLDPSGPDPTLVAAFDALLFLREPFPKRSPALWFNLGSDTTTRVLIFATDIRLNVGETASAVTVNLVDANGNSFDVEAEDVRFVPNSEVAQIRFRLPDEIMPGVCTVKVRKGFGPFSNSGTFRIAP